MNTIQRYKWVLAALVVVVVAGGAYYVYRKTRAVVPSASVSVAPAPTPTATPVPLNMDEAAPVRANLNWAEIALTPADVPDLFPATAYSVQQDIVGYDVRGSTVMFPIRAIAHTSAFAEGFSTRIQVYHDVPRAVNSYESTVKAQKGTALDMERVGDESAAFTGGVVSPEGFDLDSKETVAYVRKQNAVVTITLRMMAPAPVARMTDLAKLVSGRLGGQP